MNKAERGHDSVVYPDKPIIRFSRSFAARQPARSFLTSWSRSPNTSALRSRNTVMSKRLQSVSFSRSLFQPFHQIDIYSSAVLLIKRYGEDAAFEAAARADGLLDEGDHGSDQRTVIAGLVLEKK